jgi:hypothetical protein
LTLKIKKEKIFPSAKWVRFIPLLFSNELIKAPSLQLKMSEGALCFY